MNSWRWRAIPLLTAVMAACAPALTAQQGNLRVGYVYPAGGQQGSTFEAVIAGQFLTGVNQAHVAGGGVRAEIVEFIKPITPKELNALRIEVDELLARRAVARQDFRALEAFRSFKNAKSVKKDSGLDDEELAELKKKYAGATWTADDERRLSEVRKKMASSVRRPANPAISELAVTRITVSPDAEPGQRELRLAGPLGLSNPLVFHVGQLPEYSKPASKQIAEQNSAIAKTAVAPRNRAAQPELHVALPAVVNGQILPGAVDRFRFAATKGQELVVIAGARQLIPYIPDAVPGWFQATLALYDAAGKELAYDDDFRFDPDPVLHCRIPADGEYLVEIKDAIYRGREDFVYRITIGELPFVTSIFPLGGPADAETTVELTGWNLPATRLTLDHRGKSPGLHPVSVRRDKWLSNGVPFRVDSLPECLEEETNNEPERAQRVTPPLIVNGRVAAPNDADVFRWEGRAGDEVVAEVWARRLSSPLDSVLRLTDASGRVLGMNNDYDDKSAGLLAHQADSWLRATLPADGVYYLQLNDAQHKGGPEYGYRVRISAPQPDFALRVVPSSLTVRGGATTPFTVYAVRQDGFAGEIALALRDAPDGFTLHGGRIPAQQDQVRVTLTAPPLPREAPLPLQLEGRARIEQREVAHPAAPAEDMMQAFAYRHLVPVREFDVAVVGRAAFRPAVRIVSELPVKIPAGGAAQIRLAAPQTPFPRQLQLQLHEPPEGIQIERVSSSREGVEVVLRCDAAQVKPGLAGNLILTVAARNAGNFGKAKRPLNPRGAALAALPAIPFEVTAP